MSILEDMYRAQIDYACREYVKRSLTEEANQQAIYQAWLEDAKSREKAGFARPELETEERDEFDDPEFDGLCRLMAQALKGRQVRHSGFGSDGGWKSHHGSFRQFPPNTSKKTVWTVKRVTIKETGALLTVYTHVGSKEVGFTDWGRHFETIESGSQPAGCG